MEQRESMSAEQYAERAAAFGVQPHEEEPAKKKKKNKGKKRLEYNSVVQLSLGGFPMDLLPIVESFIHSCCVTSFQISKHW